MKLPHLINISLYKHILLLIFFGLTIETSYISTSIICFYHNTTACTNSNSNCIKEESCETSCTYFWEETHKTTLLQGCDRHNLLVGASCLSECIARYPANKREKNNCCCTTSFCNNSFKYSNSTQDSGIDPGNNNNPTSLLVIILVSITSSIFVIFSIFAIIYFKFRKRNKENESNSSVEIIERTQPNYSGDQLALSLCAEYLDSNNFKLLEEVGSGRFGRVHKAIYFKANEDSTEVAIKISSSDERGCWTNEKKVYDLLLKYPQTNLLNYFGPCKVKRDDGFDYWIVVEYVPGGSLFSYLHQNTLTWHQLLSVSLGISKAVEHLHRLNPLVAHRDIKSKNVLLRQDLTPCLADFSLATTFQYTTKSPKELYQTGTPRYMAPEVLQCIVHQDGKRFAKSDVYSLAFVLWEILLRLWPMPQEDLPLPREGIKTFENKEALRLLHQANQSDLERKDFYKQKTDYLKSIGQPYKEVEMVLTDKPIPYSLPLEELTGPSPEIDTMVDVAAKSKRRPFIDKRWLLRSKVKRYYLILEEAWDGLCDVRISAACLSDRLSSLQVSNQQQFL